MHVKDFFFYINVVLKKCHLAGCFFFLFISSMWLYVFLLVKVVHLSCIWQSHPRLLTQDPPAPGRNSKDTKAI